MTTMPVKNKLIGGLVIGLVLGGVARGDAQGFGEWEGKVSERVLPNGLKILAVERHDAPVLSFVTHVDAGSVNETTGITGLAHLFEHMAFKGTPTLGTKDWAQEKASLDKVEKAYWPLRAERLKGDRADPARLKELEATFEQAQAEAHQHLVTNAVGQLIEREGGVNLNAQTFTDWTRYFFSFPSNKFELWAALESDRFKNPVMREFYKERDVVMEERRLAIESGDPFGKLAEHLENIAYLAHPYHHDTIGHMSDLENLTATDAMDFYRKHYTPENTTIAIVGDVTAADAFRMVEKYFGDIPRGAGARPIVTREPDQVGERRFEVEMASQPLLMVGYHIPAITHPDHWPLQAMLDILISGRSSRLFEKLVKEKKIAAAVSGTMSLQGQKYPQLLSFWVTPLPGKSTEEQEAALYEEIDLIQKEPVATAELDKVKTRAKASLVRQLESDLGLGLQLAYYEKTTGDWRDLFRQIERIEAVTAADVQRVARQYMQKRNRTVGVVVHVPEETSPASRPE